MNVQSASAEAPEFTDGVTVEGKTRDQIVADEIARQALERAAKHIESLEGGDIYRKAFKVAARSVRSLKP